MEPSPTITFSNEKPDKYSTRYYPQEIIMQKQQTRQQSLMHLQALDISNWKKEEQHLINNIVVSDSFEGQGVPSLNWVSAKFNSASGILKQDLNWRDQGVSHSPVGLQLRDIVVRSVQDLTLRSLALEVKLSVRLVGDASLWIFTRGESVADSDAAICKIRKEQDSQRIFLVFGAVLGENLDFKFLSNQEIPHRGSPSEEGLRLDYTDIKICFIDQGNDLIIVKSCSKA